MYIQVMTFDQAEKSSFNPFDLTKVDQIQLFHYANTPLEKKLFQVISGNLENLHNLFAVIL